MRALARLCERVSSDARVFGGLSADGVWAVRGSIGLRCVVLGWPYTASATQWRMAAVVVVVLVVAEGCLRDGC